MNVYDTICQIVGSFVLNIGIGLLVVLCIYGVCLLREAVIDAFRFDLFVRGHCKQCGKTVILFLPKKEHSKFKFCPFCGYDGKEVDEE